MTTAGYSSWLNVTQHSIIPVFQPSTQNLGGPPELWILTPDF